jgi:ureidoacrylate peracid hydrolase
MSLELDLRYYRWYPPEKHLGYAVEPVCLDLAETAFLLVDVYCPEPEHLFLQGAISDRLRQLWYDISVERIAPALQAARSAGLPVIYVTNSGPRVALAQSEFADKLRKSLGFEMEEAFTEPMVDPREYHQGPQVQLSFPAVLEPQPGDHYVRKHVYSGFFDTRLDTLLRNLGVHNLICVGFVANACLFATIADAVFRNYKVVLLRDCTVASELPEDVEELRQTQHMILWIETIIGTTVTSSEFIAACGSASAAAGT